MNEFKFVDNTSVPKLDPIAEAKTAVIVALGKVRYDAPKGQWLKFECPSWGFAETLKARVNGYLQRQSGSSHRKQMVIQMDEGHVYLFIKVGNDY